MAKPTPTNPLYREIRDVLVAARAGAYRAVNFAMVQSYWQIGRLIVEHEQRGKRRAGYGEEVIKELAQRLTEEFGKGFTISNIKNMRQFYLYFPIGHALRGQSTPENKAKTQILDAPRRESAPDSKSKTRSQEGALVPIRHALRDELSRVERRPHHLAPGSAGERSESKSRLATSTPGEGAFLGHTLRLPPHPASPPQSRGRGDDLGSSPDCLASAWPHARGPIREGK